MTRPVVRENRILFWYRRIVDVPSPFVKQLPTLIGTVLAVLLSLTIPSLAFTRPLAALVGFGVVLSASAAAWIMSRRRMDDGWIVLLVPVADIVGLGLFRMGTGGTASLFTSLVLLPIVWIAAAPGLRPVLLVTGLTSLVLLMPYAAQPPERAVDWLRGVITPIVFGAVAAVVNELSRLARVRVADAERLAAERTAALAEKESAVEQLRQNEQQVRSMVDMYDSLWQSITVQAVIATDLVGTVKEWNPGAKRLLGLSTREAVDNVRIDRFLPEHVRAAISAENPQLPPGTPRDVVSMLFALADREGGVDGAYDIVTATGTVFPARVSVTAYKDGDGATAGYLLVISDESRAAEVSRMKDEFVGMISHELRTPLSSIVGFVDLLQHDPEHPLSDEQLGFVEVIDRNAQRLLTLVGDLLFTAQVESGRFPIEPHETDIAAVVRAAVESAGPLAATDGIRLVVDVPSRPVRLEVDAGRLGQAVDNLLSNALKFTPRGGTVTVGVAPRDGEVAISVRDTGLGIPADEQDKLFTRFFRASTATRNAVPGVGLGLTITRAIAHAHGGTMDFHSEEGVGTEFRILLPASPRTEPLTRVPQPPPEESRRPAG